MPIPIDKVPADKLATLIFVTTALSMYTTLLRIVNGLVICPGRLVAGITANWSAVIMKLDVTPLVPFSTLNPVTVVPLEIASEYAPTTEPETPARTVAVVVIAAVLLSILADKVVVVCAKD